MKERPLEAGKQPRGRERSKIPRQGGADGSREHDHHSSIVADSTACNYRQMRPNERGASHGNQHAGVSNIENFGSGPELRPDLWDGDEERRAASGDHEGVLADNEEDEVPAPGLQIGRFGGVNRRVLSGGPQVRDWY